MVFSFNSSGSDKPSPRPFSFLSFMLLVQGISNLNTGIATHVIWRTTIYLIITPVAAVLWFLFTKKCLTDLRFSGIWILPIPLLLAFATIGLYRKWLLASGLAFAVALIAQLLMVLMPPRKNSELTQINVSDESHR